MEKFKLSVIIPAKNEESNIGRCLNSLFETLPDPYATEVILVDCFSSDNTIEIAKSFPIKILSLRPEWFHSASAARYFGTKFSLGEFIFFIDADMKLEPGFLESAMALLKADPKIAAVGGIGKEIYLRDGDQVGMTTDIYRVGKKIKKIDSLGEIGRAHV
jgi:glycosyltransferase involved in cell wall biosynthesis